MLMRLFVTFIGFYSVITLASDEATKGAHHVVSVFDLRWQAFNFIVMFGFLGWKLKRPMLNFFKENETASVPGTNKEFLETCKINSKFRSRIGRQGFFVEHRCL